MIGYVNGQFRELTPAEQAAIIVVPEAEPVVEVEPPLEADEIAKLRALLTQLETQGAAL